MLKIGLHAGQQDISADDLRKLWKFADENRFDFLSCWDHLYEAPPIDGMSDTYEAVALLGAMAVETKNVRLGTHVFCMNYRNPALLAKSIATIDHLSHGRIELGLGAGWHAQEHEAFGYEFPPVKERLDRLEEGIKIIQGMFTQERTTFSGEYYKVDNVTLRPPPYQNPIPIVVGGRGEKRTLRIAARYAQGWNVPYIHLEEFERLSGVLDMWCDREQRDPEEIERSINLHMHMGATEADGTRIEKERTALFGSRPEQRGGTISGGPQQAIERIKYFQEAGAQRVSIAIRPPVDWDALYAFAEEVIPEIKKG